MKPVIILLCPPLVVASLFIIGFALEPYEIPATNSMPPRISKKYSEPLFSDVLEEHRKREGLPRGLLESVIWVETRFDETLHNPEKKSTCYKRARSDAERRRCASSGLMQTVERWHGRARNWIESIDKGSRKLGQCYRKHRQRIRPAAACYNGTGRDAQIYAAKVVKEFAIWKRRA